SAGRGRGPAVDSEPCEPVLPGGERALERRGVARREGDEEPEGAVDDRPEEVHEGQNDEAEAHAHDGQGERVRDRARHARDQALRVIAVPPVVVGGRHPAPAMGAPHRFGADLLGEYGHLRVSGMGSFPPARWYAAEGPVVQLPSSTRGEATWSGLVDA